MITTNPAGEHLELDLLPDIESRNGFYKPGEDQVSIETPDGKFWIISTAIRAQGQLVGCLNLKVSKSRLNAVTRDLVLRILYHMIAFRRTKGDNAGRNAIDKVLG